MVLAPHQGEFDLILHVLDMEGAPGIGTPRQVGHHLVGQTGDDVMDAARDGRRVALDRQKRLGHRHRDLGRIEGGHRAVAPDHLVGRRPRRYGRGTIGFESKLTST